MIELMLAIISMMLPIMLCVLVNRIIDVFQVGSRQFRSFFYTYLRGFLILIIPITVSVVLFIYFKFNPLTVFVRVLTLQWGICALFFAKT